MRHYKSNYMTDQQKALLEFVKEQHGSQVRKYTNEPYWNHPVAVANMVSLYSNNHDYCVEIALCHDLLEDTACSQYKLYHTLRSLGYGNADSFHILKSVKELTDVYTSEKYPDMNRKERKQREAERLGKISVTAQNVKYADLIDNTKSIVEHDPKFAVKYLDEKVEVLNNMRAGNINLLIECCYTCRIAMGKL